MNQNVIVRHPSNENKPLDKAGGGLWCFNFGAPSNCVIFFEHHKCSPKTAVKFDMPLLIDT